MTTTYSLEQIEAFGKAWTDAFADQRGWERHKMTDPIEDLQFFLDQNPGKLMLDSGCGWGRYVQRFLDNGLEYVGLDYSSKMLAEARVNHPHLKFIQGTFRIIPFSNNYFDCVWSCCSLSAVPKKHLTDILSEHLRVLKPRGIIMIVMPALGYSDETMYSDNAGNPEIYQSHYFLDEFCRYVEGTGFSISNAEYRRHSSSMYVLAKKPK